jgi:hypothetical protein
MEHLLGLTIALNQHELNQMFYRGDPELLKEIFNNIAKEWKKFFKPGKNVHVYNMSDEGKGLLQFMAEMAGEH